jgi:hypothetical protein
MAASRDRSGKKTNTSKSKTTRKTEKTVDKFVSRYAKDAKKSGSTLKGNPELAKAVAPKSVSPRQKTVPVKPRGGFRGGGMLGGGGGMNRTNR